MTSRGSKLTVLLALALTAGALLCWAVINHLLYSEDSWSWLMGDAVHAPKPQVSPLPIPEGLDPAMLEAWFGGPITSDFRDSSRSDHSGIDFDLPLGTPIRSTRGGTVVYAGWGGMGPGNMVVVQNGDYTYCYGHLSSVDVERRQQADTGTVVGLSGNTGLSTGPHLHYEVRYQGEPVDPTTAPVGP